MTLVAPARMSLGSHEHECPDCDGARGHDIEWPEGWWTSEPCKTCQATGINPRSHRRSLMQRVRADQARMQQAHARRAVGS